MELSLNRTGKQILNDWATRCLGKRESTDLTAFGYRAVRGVEWEELVAEIDEALRESRQNGLDHKKQHKLLGDEAEYGLFWQRFYLRGGTELYGLAEAFDCSRDEPIWRDRWNEVIRIGFKKPTLRAVDPTEFVESMVMVMNKVDWARVDQFVRDVIADLCVEKVDETKPQWSPAMLKGK
jgi:hypothetical protein